ncbi:outer membrane protein assembly factor BamB family protein [Nocardiopsis alba]|uniref:PQQ enzyme repeat family protein n=1 Tax=Nocardiopsis alba (strain ATCC BAA-2165 / BE74) TaxID=1205910 RepID=J7LF52_NOCAA|nr:PQQ-binding-like beta-propeller repeat protein [Nocardiopsis alba]AFR09494.1 PQQ enzyme repeat family protein [Nocardiopsis alba ATCC BAA-2165]
MNKRIIFVGSTATLALATVGAFLLWPTPFGDHRIIVQDVEPAETPGTIQEVSWTWEPDEETTAQSVFIGPAGPIVMYEDGVSALDGSDGTEIWSYRVNDLRTPSSRSDSIRVGVTSDREYTVLAWHPRETVEYVNMAVLESGSGELIDEYRFSPAEEEADDGARPPLPSLERLSTDTWLEPDGDGFAALSIFTGEKKWEYIPNQECRILHNYSHKNFEDFSVLIGDNTLIFGRYCGEDFNSDSFQGDLIGLDAKNGTEKWTINNIISLAKSEIDIDHGVRKTDMKPMWDPGYITVSTTKGNSLVEIDGGNIILDDTRDLFPDSPRDSGILDANEERVIDVTRHLGDQPSIFTTADTRSGDIESTATLPSTDFNHYLLLPEDLNISFSWPNIIPLSGGVLTTTCKNECENNAETDYTDTVTSIPSTPEKEEVTVEIPLPSDTSSKSTHTLLASPGSVIAYMKNEGSIPEIFGLK